MNFLYCLFLFSVQGKGLITKQTLLIMAFSAFLCTSLFLKDMWKIEYKKKYLVRTWIFALCYCIPFVSTVLLAATHGDTYTAILFTAGLLLLSYLVDWFLFINISVIGIALGWLYNITMFENLYIDIPKHTILASIASLTILTFVIKLTQNETEEKIKTLELFGGAMAHEAKSPMNSLVMSNSLLQDITKDFIVLEHDEKNYKLQLSKSQYEMLKELPNLNEAIGKSGRVAVDLLLLAMRNDEMKAVDDFGKYYVKECVDETIKEFVIDQREKKLININLKKDFYFKGSKTFMKATIINLIKNAFKHGGSNVKIDILIDHYTMIVKDNGSGIPDDKIDKIFDKYYTSSGSGTGIGLALCDKFMESIGGSIRCESKSTEYTKFTLEFPKEEENNTNIE